MILRGRDISMTLQKEELLTICLRIFPRSIKGYSAETLFLIPFYIEQVTTLHEQRRIYHFDNYIDINLLFSKSV